MRRGSRRRTTRVLAAAGALALVALVAPRIAAIGGTAAPGDHPGSRDATIGGPLVSGSTSYVSGTLAWTDYAYDDKGANTDPLPGGDTAYPSGTEPKNAADIIQTQVGLTQAGD